MKYSKNWLQEYIAEELPEDKVIEDVLNAKAFEVEGVEAYSPLRGQGGLEKEISDTIFDIKVLPNRAHDALCHLGMARELCACLDLTFSPPLYERGGEGGVLSDTNIKKVEIKIEDNKACTRFMAVRIDGVVVNDSPEWLKNKLESIGQRSINNIVDITNYVQYSINKPMHAYDADNIVGTLQARYANENEILVTLDDKELILNTPSLIKRGLGGVLEQEKVLVISDDEKALGLAGIKGGRYSGINKNTTSIVIESANFNPALIRKTSQKYNIKTDASKRFENGISDVLVESGLLMTISEILKLFPNAKVGEISDTRTREYKNYKTGVTLKDINGILGSNINEQELENILKRLNFEYEKVNTIEKLKELVKISIDKPYKRAASVTYDAPNYFDCSSLTNYLYKESYEHIPRVSIDQHVFSREITKEEARFGDLVFTNTKIIKTKESEIYSQVLGKIIQDSGIRTESLEFMKGSKVSEGVDHVGFYLGDGQVLHASSSNGKVTIEKLSEVKAFSNPVSYRRPFENIDGYSYIIDIPNERLDLRNKEDIVEEVGRISGYEKLIPILPNLKKVGALNFKLSIQNIIRNILNKNNFSEVITYSLTNVGDIELVKSASDKTKLRTNISDGLLEALNKNTNNMPLLNLDIIKTYEMGSVFTLKKETKEIVENLSLCIAMGDNKKKNNFEEIINNILLEIGKELGIKKESEIEKINFETLSHKIPTKPYVIEINLSELIEKIKDKSIDNVFLDLDTSKIENVKYKSFSQMPFVVRDVAFWCDIDTDKFEILDLIKNNAGQLCVSVNIFDQFTKEIEMKDKGGNILGKRVSQSLGYRLVYQDKHSTLTDNQVNVYVENVYSVLKEKDFTIR